MQNLYEEEMYFQETFVSPVPLPSKEEAQRVLEEIRKCHTPQDGWEELNAYIKYDCDANGKYGYFAVRTHRKKL